MTKSSFPLFSHNPFSYLCLSMPLWACSFRPKVPWGFIDCNWLLCVHFTISLSLLFDNRISMPLPACGFRPKVILSICLLGHTGPTCLSILYSSSTSPRCGSRLIRPITIPRWGIASLGRCCLLPVGTPLSEDVGYPIYHYSQSQPPRPTLA